MAKNRNNLLGVGGQRKKLSRAQRRTAAPRPPRTAGPLTNSGRNC